MIHPLDVELVHNVAYFLQEYPPEFVIGLFLLSSVLLSFFWLAIGFGIEKLISLGGE